MRTGIVNLKDYFPFLGEDGRNATLEYYLPYNMTEMNREDQKRPCMLICPGGGYGFCSQREAEPIALNMLPLGFNAFVLTYSISPHRFPAQLIEVAAAMELICSKADEWNCDTEKIGIMGFSAGAHLAAHYSNAYDFEEVRKIFPESKRPFATVLAYPVITSDPKKAHIGSFYNLLGNPLPENTERFSCEKLVTDKTPPAFIWHTAADNGVPVENSTLYAAALAEHNVPFELHIYPYGWHGLATCDSTTVDGVTPEVEYDERWKDELKRFLRQFF